MSNVIKFNPLTRKIELAAKQVEPLRGEKGEKGDKGEQGERGLRGLKGLKGEKGDRGEQGLRGEQGAIGATGLKGDKGDKGDIGEQGEKGLDGSLIHKIEGFPKEELGKQGDWAFNNFKEVFYKTDKWNFYLQLGSGGSRVNKIEDIGNVKISSITNNQVLSWNGASWVNRTVTGGSGSGITREVYSVNSNQTAADAATIDYVYFLSVGATLTMPTAVGNTNEYHIKNVTSNNVFVNFTGLETGEGETTLTIPAYNSITLYSDNSNWWIV